MKTVIIGIHGLGNKPDQEILYKWWQAAIDEGLSRASLNPGPYELDLVYWADLLHETPQDPDIEDKNDPLYIEDPYTPSDPTQNNNNKPSERRKKILNMIGHQLDGIFLNKNLTINFTSVNDFVIRRFFKDLAVYYNTLHEDEKDFDPEKKELIRARFAETLLKHRKKRIMIIAHSMGGIIAFDVLTALGGKVVVDTLVTVGCPLGLPIIRSKIAAEHSINDDPKSMLRTPVNVIGSWYNLADLRDKIALYYQLSESFRPNIFNVGVKDIVVTNDYRYKDLKNPHKVYGYLRTPEMSDIIHRFLTCKPPGLISRFRNWLGALTVKWF